MTKNVKHGLGLLVVAALCGLAFLLLNAFVSADATDSQAAEVAGYAVLAAICCGAVGLVYLAIGLLRD